MSETVDTGEIASCLSCGEANGMRPYVDCPDEYHKAQFDGDDGFVPLGYGEPVRCEGGYVGALDDKVSGGRAACPSCGRVISFHRVTGKFKAHNVPHIGGSASERTPSP